MSFMRNLVKTAGRFVGCTAQPTANFSRNVETLRRQESPKPRPIHPRYFKNLIDDGRYVIKDKSSLPNLTLPKFRMKIMENQYILQKAKIEKKKCFQNIETMQKRYEMRKKKTVMPQTFYDSEQPNLWMKVKFMYAPHPSFF